MDLKDATHTCCVTAYHIDGDPRKTIVRLTAIVVDLKSDEIVDRLFFKPFEDDAEETGDKIALLAAKYNALVVMTGAPVPLIPCPCGKPPCDGFLSNVAGRETLDKYAASLSGPSASDSASMSHGGRVGLRRGRQRTSWRRR